MSVSADFPDLVKFFPEELKKHVLLKFTQPALKKLVAKGKDNSLEHAVSILSTLNNVIGNLKNTSFKHFVNADFML